MFFFDRLRNSGVLRAVLPVFVLGMVCLASGCNNTCFFGVVNPPNNSVTVVGGSSVASVCAQAPITGVIVGGNVASNCTNCSASEQVTHAYLVVSGVEFHPSAVADTNSPDWQELRPELAQHPRVVDLAANSTLQSEEFESPLVANGRIRAGEYYEVRLRLAESSMLPEGDVQLLTAQGCPSATRSGCIVNADHSAHELETLEGQPFLLVQTAIPVDLRAGRENRIQLLFHPEWVLRQTSRGVEVAPVLQGEVREPATVSLAK